MPWRDLGCGEPRAEDAGRCATIPVEEKQLGELGIRAVPPGP